MKLFNKYGFTAAKVLALTGALSFAGSALAADNLIPRIPANPAQYKVFTDIEYANIVVKFKEATGIRLNNSDLFSKISNPEMPASMGMDWSGFDAELTNIENLLSTKDLDLSKLFGIADEVLADLKKKGEEKSGKELADLGLYFKLPIPSGYDADQIQAFIDALNAFETIEVAYANPKAEPAALTPDFQDHNPEHTYYQGYLDAPTPSDDNAFDGINAKYAWNFSGGHGEGVNVIDVEGGWRVTHEDFPALAFPHHDYQHPNWINHGTAVVGVIAGVDNGFGVTGIANQANIGVSSIYRADGGYIGSTGAVQAAIDMAGNGGIVLIEMHKNGPQLQEECACNNGQCNYIAIEYWQDSFDAIATATANGVTVVEAAGNGSANLDDPIYEDAFNRSNRDSGAILVGASRSKNSDPMCWTNYGSRVDIRGWGEMVATLDYGGMYKDPDDIENRDKFYTGTFSGTSSASPIVTGAAAVLQGIAQNTYGTTLTPAQIREILVSTSTEQTLGLEKNIGGLPDLERAITLMDSMLNFECSEYSDTNSNHEAAGRAYSETVTEGETCWGTFCFGGTDVTTWYAVGSDEDLGTNGNATTTLHERTDGEFASGVCPGPDVTAPVITLTGDNPMTVYQDSEFTDPGATAEDNIDGDITSDIVVAGYVDTNSIDTYELVYTVSDAAGNEATETRTVNVIAVPACQEYTDTAVNHETAGRAYSETKTEGETCWGTFCYGGTTVTTWYAQGSNENLGDNGNATITLRTSENGYITGNCPTDPVAPVIESYDYTVNYHQIVVTGTASDADGDIQKVSFGTPASGVDCEGTTNFTCTLSYEEFGFEVGEEIRFALGAMDSRNEWSEYVYMDITRPEQQASVPPVISNLQQTREGTVEIVTLDVTDVDGDLDSVFLVRLDDIGVVECSNTSGSQFRCEMQLQGTDYATMTWKARAIDLAENTTDSAEFTVDWQEQVETCFTAANSEHISAGRAELRYNVLVYANGSNDYLGMSVDTTSLQEQTQPGNWVKVASCN